MSDDQAAGYEEWLRSLLKELFQQPIEKLSFAGQSVSQKPNLRRLLIEFDDNGDKTKKSNRAVLIQRIQHMYSHSEVFMSAESIFYDRLSHLSTASLPHCLHSSHRLHNGTFAKETIRIFEDLPQLKVCTGSIVDLNLLQVKAAAIELGKFHSSFFSQELPPIVPSASDLLTGSSGFELNLTLFFQKWSGLLEEFADEEKGGKNIPREVFEHCNRYVENWKMLLEMGPSSLLHGNYRPENLLLHRGGAGEESEPAVTIFNFQSIFQGASSVELSSSLSHDEL
jgi:hypothetical protein